MLRVIIFIIQRLSQDRVLFLLCDTTLEFEECLLVQCSKKKIVIVRLLPQRRVCGSGQEPWVPWGQPQPSGQQCCFKCGPYMWPQPTHRLLLGCCELSTDIENKNLQTFLAVLCFTMS